MKKTFSPLDEFIKTHTTAENVHWLSERLREACSILSIEARGSDYVLGLLTNSVADAAYAAKLLDKQLNPKDEATTIVA